MPYEPVTFSVAGQVFTVSFAEDGEHVVALLDAQDSNWDPLTECLVVAWKLFPIPLLESLCDRRVVQVGEFYTITFENIAGSRENVSINDGETELIISAAFYTDVVLNMAKAHLARVGDGHFPWFARLSEAAKSIVA